jgi:hypothetical protein
MEVGSLEKQFIYPVREVVYRGMKMVLKSVKGAGGVWHYVPWYAGSVCCSADCFRISTPTDAPVPLTLCSSCIDKLGPDVMPDSIPPITIITCGKKFGELPPIEGGTLRKRFYADDLRSTNRFKGMRGLDGTHPKVLEIIRGCRAYEAMLNYLMLFVSNGYATEFVLVDDAGWQRSVSLGELFKAELDSRGIVATLTHRDLHRRGKLPKSQESEL